MRISAQAKAETRQRILEAAGRLLQERGFAETTTRDVARVAGIATGTLFNYFATKEALALELVATAVGQGRDDFLRRRRGDESLREDLFAHVAAGFRRLAPLRRWLAEVVEAALVPLGPAARGDPAVALREDHLEQVRALVAEHRPGTPVPGLQLHLYWTLYLGVLSFWSRDGSPHQQDALVLLDRSMGLFASALEDTPGGADASAP